MFIEDFKYLFMGNIKVVESLSSILPPGVVQLGRKVTHMKWKSQGFMENRKGM